MRAVPTSRPADLTLVVPCYRPSAAWADRLADRFEAFAKTLAPLAVDLVLVHDGTPGGLDPAELRRLRSRLPEVLVLDDPVNRGKGAALRRGVSATAAPVVMYTDVDLPYTTASMTAVAEGILARGGVVTGERYEEYYVTVPFWRRLLSRAHRYAMRRLFKLPVSDSQAGLKGFDESGKTVFLETSVDRFLVDLDFIARCRGRVSVTPVRVELRPDVVFTNFGLGILRTETRNFLQILKTSWTRRD